jgi:hypothetical protein
MKHRWVVAVLVAAVLILAPSMALANTPAPSPVVAKAPTFASERHIVRDLYDVDAMSQSVPKREARSLECYMLLAAGWLYALGGHGSNAMAWAVITCNAEASQE